jgi:hypothetical protein
VKWRQVQLPYFSRYPNAVGVFHLLLQPFR